MSVKFGIALISLGVFVCAPAALAKNHSNAKRGQAVQPAHISAPGLFGGGRLVLNPANNIACNTRDRPSRAIPCDQPVWVYGSPCEIDEGEGFYRDCDQPPGVGIHDRWRNGRP